MARPSKIVYVASYKYYALVMDNREICRYYPMRSRPYDFCKNEAEQLRHAFEKESVRYELWDKDSRNDVAKADVVVIRSGGSIRIFMCGVVSFVFPDTLQSVEAIIKALFDPEIIW